MYGKVFAKVDGKINFYHDLYPFFSLGLRFLLVVLRK
jgi:hypothetical protein